MNNAESKKFFKLKETISNKYVSFYGCPIIFDVKTAVKFLANAPQGPYMWCFELYVDDAS
jgi:hypothetical protein